MEPANDPAPVSPQPTHGELVLALGRLRAALTFAELRLGKAARGVRLADPGNQLAGELEELAEFCRAERQQGVPREHA